MKSNGVAKGFLFCSVVAVLLVLYKMSKYSRFTINSYTKQNIYETESKTEEYNRVNVTKKLDMKYILLWTSPGTVPFVDMGEGQEGFIRRNCSVTACFVTANRSYLSDHTKFDVIAFAGPEVRHYYSDHLPERRSLNQKYVFASIESAANYPVCSERFNGFFNWTWTYRLDSDARWGYIAIRDSNYNLIGPKVNMHWIKWEDMEPVSDDIRIKLKSKTKAVAWFISNCYSTSGREVFYEELRTWLNKYALKIDVFGKCGFLSCPRDSQLCNEMIARDYYFYLSFENALSEDYVTEKLLHPLMNYAVPIVYGGANYTRFMPEGIYLDAIKLGAEKLAHTINELMKNPYQYAEYFRWRRYYSYHNRLESTETNEYCRFCSMLHEEDLVKKTSVYMDFRDWWDPPNVC